MKAGWLTLLLVVAAASAGCTGGGPANPNLAAPKLVVGARPDGNATVFIHSAFSERLYDWIHLRVDNETVVNTTEPSFSLEHVLPPGFYLEVTASTNGELYDLRARVDVFAEEERASVVFVDADGEWADDAESFGLPLQRLLERRG